MVRHGSAKAVFVGSIPTLASFSFRVALISVLVPSFGEILKVIELLGKKSPEKLHSDYANCIIAITAEISVRWRELSSQGSPPIIGSLVAAIALEFGLTLATRNTRDFDGLGIPIVNPVQ